MFRTQLIFFLLVLPLLSFCQDAHFSQFYTAPAHLNPALTGVYEGRFRIVANYREQWGSLLNQNPFRTVSASFDIRYPVRGNSGDYFAVGVFGLRDEAGDARFTQNRGYLTASFLKQLSGNRYRTSDQYLVVGGQLGFGQNSINWNDLWFSSQFDDQIGAPNPGNISSGEPGINSDRGTTDLFLDAGAGLLYYALFEENRSIYFGGAVYHINQPDISFLGNPASELYMRWQGHAGGELPFTDELSLLPAVVVMGQGPSFQTMAGGNLRYTNHDWNEIAIRVGAWGRVSNMLEDSYNMDALIFSAILELNSYNLGISYDITTSSLTEANNSRGGFELSFIYVHPAKRKFRVNCPKY